MRGGEYYGPGGWNEWTGYPERVQSIPRSHDAEAARRLWEVSEQLTGVTYHHAGQPPSRTRLTGPALPGPLAVRDVGRWSRGLRCSRLPRVLAEDCGEHLAGVGQARQHSVRARGGELGGRELAGGDADGAGAGSQRRGHIERCVAHQNG